MTRGRVFAAGVGLALLTAAWLGRDYRLPRDAQSRNLNSGRKWEFRSRIDSKGVAQVWVPPGCFEMGSDPLSDLHARAEETPRHTVCISKGFWLDRFEVTNESWMKFVVDGGFLERRWWSEEGWRAHEGRRAPYPMLSGWDSARQPRVKVTWYEAEAYAAWRGGRLPTEAQWEWAARGPESRRYPWGDHFAEGKSNMDHPDLRCTRPVGSYPAGRSWVGADDMAGNAWEWTADGYNAEAYRRAPRLDPFTPPTGPLRVIRGGAWGGVPGGSAADVRCARRAYWWADNRKLSHGMRIISP